MDLAGPIGRGWWSWCGAALVGAGLLGAARAQALGTPPDLSRVPGWSRVACVLVAVGLVSVVAVMIRARRQAMRHGSVREGVHPGWWFGGLAAVASVGAVPALWAVKLDIDRGFPTMALPLLGVSLLVAALGCGLLSRGLGRQGGWGPPGQPRRMVAAGASVVIAVGVAASASGVAWWVEHRLPLQATTASVQDPVELPPPGDVAWVREVPESTGQDPWNPPVFNTRAPVAASSGLILEQRDGVTALDGRTGAERWRYRRPGAERVAALGNPAGTWVLLVLAPGGDQDGEIWRYVGLDGATGEVGFEFERRPGGVWRGVDLPAGQRLRAIGLTDHTLVLSDHAGTRLVGIDLQTATSRWQWRSPEGCDFDFDGYDGEMGADSVVLSGYCANDAVTVGLDDRSGSEAWRHTVPDDEHGEMGPVRIEMATRHDVASLTWEDQDNASRGVVVDAATGDELFNGSTGFEPVHVSHDALIDPVSASGDDQRRSLTYRVVEAGGRSTEVTLSDCDTVQPHGIAVVASALVAVCSGADYDTPPAETEPTVRVIDLDDPGSAQVIEIDPDTTVEPDSTEPILNDPPRLLVLPGVLLVAWDEGTRITALE